MPKSVEGAEGCLLEDGVKPESKAGTTLVAELRFECGSGSFMSTAPLPTRCLVFGMLLAVFLVLNQVILFAAAADDWGGWPSKSNSSL